MSVLGDGLVLAVVVSATTAADGSAITATQSPGQDPFLLKPTGTTPGV
jgi:hypothetical protein